MGEVGVPALGRSLRLSDGDATLLQGQLSATQTPPDAKQAVITQADAATDQMKAHKAGAHCGTPQVGLVGVEPQAQFGQFGLQHHQGLSQGLGPVGEQGQIIHVAQAGPDAGQHAQAVIDGVEVEIGQKLAGEVADWQPPWPFQGGEQGVAGESIDGGAAASAVGQDGADQPEGARAGDQTFQLGKQEAVIDGGEVQPDVCLQHPGMLAAGAGKAAQGTVGAVALAIGVAGGQEVALQGLGNHSDEGVMHHPIAEGGDTHEPGFGFVNRELPIGA